MPMIAASGARRFLNAVKDSPLSLGLLLAAVVAAGHYASMTWQVPFPRDVDGYAIGRDFLNAWTYGREAWSGEAGRFYDIKLYNIYLTELTGWAYPGQQWSYAPHFLLVMAPFGLLSYLQALFLWTVLSLLALAWALPGTGNRPFAFLALLLAPAGVVCWISGQASFLILALLVGIYRNLDRRPVLAGILLGVLTVKPQLGLLFPLMLILTGRWRVFFAAAATTCALVAVTAVIWGVDIWRIYLSVGAPMQELVLRYPTLVAYCFMPTAYMHMRMLGASADLAYLVQAVVALGAVAAVVWTYRRPRDPLLSYAVLLVAGLVATPYLMSYDVLVTAWIVLAIGLPDMRARLLALIVYLVPFIAFLLGWHGIPGVALVLPLFLLYLVRRLAGAEAAFPAPAALASR